MPKRINAILGCIKKAISRSRDDITSIFDTLDTGGLCPVLQSTLQNGEDCLEKSHETDYGTGNYSEDPWHPLFLAYQREGYGYLITVCGLLHITKILIIEN